MALGRACCFRQGCLPLWRCCKTIASVLVIISYDCVECPESQVPLQPSKKLQFPSGSHYIQNPGHSKIKLNFLTAIRSVQIPSSYLSQPTPPQSEPVSPGYTHRRRTCLPPFSRPLSVLVFGEFPCYLLIIIIIITNDVSSTVSIYGAFVLCASFPIPTSRSPMSCLI